MNEEQKKIIKEIRKVVRRKIDEKNFVDPQVWKAQGESHGHLSVLIVVHDGGEHASYFNWDYCAYKAVDRMEVALRAIGCYTEQCTSWYSAIYPIPLPLKKES